MARSSSDDFGGQPLIFEKAGVCYAQLDDETAGRLVGHSGISDIRLIDNLARDSTEFGMANHLPTGEHRLIGPFDRESIRNSLCWVLPLQS